MLSIYAEYMLESEKEGMDDILPVHTRYTYYQGEV